MTENRRGKPLPAFVHGVSPPGRSGTTNCSRQHSGGLQKTLLPSLSIERYYMRKYVDKEYIFIGISAVFLSHKQLGLLYLKIITINLPHPQSTHLAIKFLVNSEDSSFFPDRELFLKGIDHELNTY